MTSTQPDPSAENRDEQPAALITGQKLSVALRKRARSLRQELTLAERLVWLCLRRNQLLACHFRRQQIVGGFIVDFYCASARLVIEVDGPVHESQREQDRNRDAILSTHGVRILRFTNEQIKTNLGDVLEVIRLALATPPPALPLQEREKTGPEGPA